MFSSSSSLHEIILTSSPEGPITAYNPSSAATLTHFSGSRSPRRGLVFAGKTFIVASHISPTTGSGSIHLYNWWSSTPSHIVPLPEPVAPLASTLDGFYLFAGGLSGTIYTISLPGGEILRGFSAHDKPVSSLKISQDGSLLISGGDDGTIVTTPIFQLVDASNDENSSDLILQKVYAHSGTVTAISTCMTIRNLNIISCSMDCTCKLWRLQDGALLLTITFPCAILGSALDPTEIDLYAAGSDGFIYKRSLSTGSRYPDSDALHQRHDGMVVAVEMLNEGKNLVSASEDGGVFVWDLGTGQVIMDLGKDNMGIRSISDMVVASGNVFGDKENDQENKMKADDGRVLELNGEELSRKIMGMVDLEDVLKIAEKDRTKAIDILESAIAMYEKLLELILKEAMEVARITDEQKK